MKRLALLAATLTLAGCGTPIAVDGQTADGEQFTGTLTAEGREFGPLEIRNASGVVCTGTWQFDTDQRGSATLSCSDGRTGSAELSSLEVPGKMSGMLGGKLFRGTYERLPI